MLRGVLPGLCLAALWAAPLRAQEEEASPPAQAPADSLFPQSPLSAGGAFWRSVVIPGWAQAELGAPGRGAFYFLTEAFCIFMIARTEKRLNHAERTWPEDSGVIDSRRQQKEDWIALAIFTAFFSGADGWVSVKLFGFDERTGFGPDDVAFTVGWEIPLAP